MFDIQYTIFSSQNSITEIRFPVAIPVKPTHPSQPKQLAWAQLSLPSPSQSAQPTEPTQHQLSMMIILCSILSTQSILNIGSYILNFEYWGELVGLTGLGKLTQPNIHYWLVASSAQHRQTSLPSPADPVRLFIFISQSSCFISERHNIIYSIHEFQYSIPNVQYSIFSRPPAQVIHPSQLSLVTQPSPASPTFPAPPREPSLLGRNKTSIDIQFSFECWELKIEDWIVNIEGLGLNWT